MINIWKLIKETVVLSQWGILEDNLVVYQLSWLKKKSVTVESIWSWNFEHKLWLEIKKKD